MSVGRKHQNAASKVKGIGFTRASSAMNSSATRGSRNHLQTPETLAMQVVYRVWVVDCAKSVAYKARNCVGATSPCIFPGLMACIYWAPASFLRAPLACRSQGVRLDL